MKTLYLIRHGKAEEHSFFKRDFERNLVDKGIERSNLIADKLINQLVPSQKILLISSIANRALQTAKIFCEKIGYPIDNIQLESSIYEAHYLDVLNVVNQVSDDIDVVLIFGHNPGLSFLTNYICNSYIDLKTSHVAKVNLEKGFNFSEVSGRTGYLEKVITELVD